MRIWLSSWNRAIHTQIFVHSISYRACTALPHAFRLYGLPYMREPCCFKLLICSGIWLVLQISPRAHTFLMS